MKNLLKLGLVSLALTSVLMTACSNKEKETPAASSDSKIEASEEPTEESTAETTETEKTTGAVDFSKLETEVKELIDADTFDVIFTSPEAVVTKQGDLNISLDGYEVIEATDFHNDYSIVFGDNTDRGGLILSQYTIKNDGDAPIFLTASFDYTFTGAQKHYNNKKNLIPDDFDDIGSTVYKMDKQIKPGEEVTAHGVASLDSDALNTITDLGVVTLLVPSTFNKADSINQESRLAEEQKVNLPLTADGADKVATDAQFYGDKLTLDNMGEKNMLVEKDDLRVKETLDNVTVTLQGYQFVDFEPNTEEAPRFKNYKNGTVVLTAKFFMTSENEKKISLRSSSSILHVNNGDQKLLSEGMILPYRSEVVEKGGEHEYLQSYILDKEQYDKIWKDKDFSIDLSLRDDDSKEIGKGKDLSFDLPK